MLPPALHDLHLLHTRSLVVSDLAKPKVPGLSPAFSLSSNRRATFQVSVKQVEVVEKS